MPVTPLAVLVTVTAMVFASPCGAATVSFGQLPAGQDLAIANPTDAAIAVAVRVPPLPTGASTPPVQVVLQPHQTFVLANALRALGSNTENAVVQVTSDQDVELSVPELGPLYPGEQRSVAIRHVPSENRTGTLVLHLTGEARVEALTPSGAVRGVRTYRPGGDGATFRIPYRDLLGEIAFDGVLRITPVSGLVVSYVDAPSGRRRSVGHPGGRAVLLTVSGRLCANQAAVQVAAPVIAGAIYRWTVRNGVAVGGASGASISIVPSQRGAVTAELSMEALNRFSFGSVHVAVSDRPAIERLRAFDAVEGADAIIQWDVAGEAAGRLFGTDFPAAGIVVALGAGEYRYRASSPGGKSVELVAENDCGTMSSRDTYTVASSCVTPSAQVSAPSSVTASSTFSASMPSGAGSYSWSVSNGTITAGQNTRTVTITAGSSGAMQVTGTASNGAGCTATDSASVTITMPAPKIVSFTADTYVVDFAGSTTLRFTIQNAASWTLRTSPRPPLSSNHTYPSSGTGSGTHTAQFARDSRYGIDIVTLEVLGLDGSTVTAQLAIDDPAPEIRSFTADSTSVAFGGTTTLRFDIRNVVSWKLMSSRGNGTTPGNGSGSGNVTSTYTRAVASGADVVTLEATDLDGNTVTAHLTIN